jgi:predicted HD phosphohydrolase
MIIWNFSRKSDDIMTRAQPIPLTFASFADVEALLRTFETTPCDEPGLTELDHGLQCAEALRKMAPDDVGLQVAGLLHDVAHGACHIDAHHEVGADALEPLFGSRIAQLVRLHVDAKRYLVATRPAYRARLSPISMQSLMAQGGAMSDDEVAGFEARPWWREGLRLRVADEAAKVIGQPTSGLDHWLPLVRSVCAGPGGARA